MIRCAVWALLTASVFSICLASTPAKAEQQAFGRVWGGAYGPNDWERFYHYPQNFWGHEYYRSSEDLYYRYPQEMRIPVYNKKWQNYYPSSRRWHSGHHFMLDVF